MYMDYALYSSTPITLLFLEDDVIKANMDVLLVGPKLLQLSFVFLFHHSPSTTHLVCPPLGNLTAATNAIFLNWFFSRLPVFYGFCPLNFYRLFRFSLQIWIVLDQKKKIKNPDMSDTLWLSVTALKKKMFCHEHVSIFCANHQPWLLQTICKLVLSKK